MNPMKTRLITVLLVIGSAFIAQDISSRAHFRIDVTKKKLYSLSEKSLNVLKMLDGSPLRVTAFLEEEEYGRLDAENLLQQYAGHYPGLNVIFVSPSKNPGLVAEYGIGSHATLVWEYEKRRVKMTGLTEEDFTNGILRLVRPRHPIVYMTTGHGEKSVSKEYSALGRYLGQESYDLRDLLIQKNGGIPSDTDCLLIAGPKKDFFPEEIRMIDDYIKRGGRAVLLLDPFLDGGFTEILASYGILLPADVVVDKAGKMFGGDELFPMSVEYPPHPITRSMDGVCMFPVARTVATGVPPTPHVEARPLALTSDKAWGESDREALKAGTSSYDPAHDVKGPLPLAASVEIKAEDPKNDGAIVIVGDSDFISNLYFDLAGNKDFFLNSLAWLTGSKELVGIRAHESENHPIILSQGQGLLLAVIVMGLLPGIFVLLGIRAWYRRRAGP